MIIFMNKLIAIVSFIGAMAISETKVELIY